MQRAIFIVLFLTACGSSSDGGNGADLPLNSASAMISAATGGTITLEDGTQITIPPSALTADTMITVSRAPVAAYSPEGVVASVLLEPEGLALSAPVEVVIPYDATGIESEDDLIVVHSSTLTQQVDVGGELSASEEIIDVVRAPGRVTASIDHFSLLDLFWLPKMFVAPILPGRTLRSGDILYTLTGGDNHTDAWTLPLHVGLFVRNSLNDGIIESTVPTAGCPEANGVVEGTYRGNCGLLSLRGQHIFVGARRPNRDVTVAQGEAAVATARRWLNLPYGVSALPSDLAGTGISCVQLTEDAWEGAGVNPSRTPDQLLTPYAQFSNTVPVDDITVDVADGEVRIPIVVAVRTTDIFSASVHSYTAAGASRVPATITMTVEAADPDAAERFRLETPQAFLGENFGPQGAQDLVFTPMTEDIGFSFRISLRVEVPSRGYVRDYPNFLRIEVANEPGGECTMPVEYVGTLSGTTSGGGDFSISFEDRTIWMNIFEASEGDDDPTFSFAVIRELTLINGELSIYGELPARPRGGLVYELPLPRAGMIATDWYFQTPTFACTVGETVREFGANIVGTDGYTYGQETVTGQATVALSRDCGTITVSTSLMGSNRDGTSCMYTGTFVGTRSGD